MRNTTTVAGARVMSEIYREKTDGDQGLAAREPRDRNEDRDARRARRQGPSEDDSL
jgi:hypothetical protein